MACATAWLCAAASPYSRLASTSSCRPPRPPHSRLASAKSFGPPQPCKCMKPSRACAESLPCAAASPSNRLASAKSGEPPWP
eukprot:scaffold4613_cov77-Phaeocystis_antarctica.AAC.4